MNWQFLPTGMPLVFYMCVVSVGVLHLKGPGVGLAVAENASKRNVAAEKTSNI